MSFTLPSSLAELDQTRQHARYLRLRIARAENNWRAGRVRDAKRWRVYYRALLDELRDTELRVAALSEGLVDSPSPQGVHRAGRGASLPGDVHAANEARPLPRTPRS